MWKTVLSSTTHYVLSALIAASIIIWFDPGLFMGGVVIFTALFATRRAEKVLLCRWKPGRDSLGRIIAVLAAQLIVIGLFYSVFVSSLIFSPAELPAHLIAEVKAIGYSGIFSILLSMLIYLGFNAYRWKQRFIRHIT